MKKDLHPEKRACNSLKRSAGQVSGVEKMIHTKRSLYEVLVQLLAAKGALEKIILVYFRCLIIQDLQQRIRALLELTNLQKKDAESLKKIDSELNNLCIRMLLKSHYKIEKMERQIQSQNIPCWNLFFTETWQIPPLPLHTCGIHSPTKFLHHANAKRNGLRFYSRRNYNFRRSL